jgi:hypothetical protein
MSSLKYPRWSPAESRHPASLSAQRLAASGLRSASALLARLARRLAPPVKPKASPAQHLEFHAEAGAPEGALYLDGKLVGWLPGVRRL